MKSISAGMTTHLGQEVTSLCTCWHLTRQDGTEYHFTDHDQDVVYDGDTYTSAYGYNRTAIANDSSLAVDNLDLVGILDSTEISAEELRAGLFDYAQVEIFLINWADTADGIIKMRKGFLGEVTITQTGIFKAELRGLTQLLSQRVVDLYTGTCRADLGDDKCGFVLEATYAWAASTAYGLGDIVYGSSSGNVPENVNLTNPGAETGNTSGWTTSGSPRTMTSWFSLSAFLGDRFFGGFVSSGYMYQDYTLPVESTSSSSTSSTTSGTTTAEELETAKFGAMVAHPTTANGDSMTLSIHALDASDIELDSATVIPAVEDEWKLYTVELELPANTAKVRVRWDFTKGTGAYAFSVMDAAFLLVGDTTIVDKGDFYFECTTAGTSGSTEPLWPDVEGNTVTDGTVEWTAVDQKSSWGTVVAGLTRTTFSVEGVSGDTDDYYNGGLLTWLSGSNEGRSMEVKDFDSNTNLLTLFLEAPYEPAAGDVFEIHPGCDKKLKTCKDTFDNIVNFRGEPFIPGQDEFLRYPNAK